MKHFKCSSLVPGCAWETRNENSAEIVRRVTDHLRTAHDEKIIRPTIVDEIKKRIKDSETA